MSRKRILYKNILETSAVSLTAGTANAEFGLEYLYDRAIGIPFMSTAAETIRIHIDQGASGILDVDRLILVGNLDGMTLDIKYSDDNISYYAATAQWVQSGNGLINKSWATQTHRYWDFIITGPASIPEIMELFLGLTYELERDPSYGSLTRGLKDGVVRTELYGGGVVYKNNWSAEKKFRRWPLARTTSAMTANLKTLDQAWGGKKPYFVEDDDGTWFFAEQLKRLEERAIEHEYSAFDLEVLEVLP